MSARTFLNVGSWDRALRALLGIALLSVVFVGPLSPWGYLGLIPLFTASIGWCPLYSLAGISTEKAAA
jgi:hypothetical protein